MTAPSDRSQAWAATMPGHPRPDGITLAHAGAALPVGAARRARREVREEWQDSILAPGATRARGAGRRARAEQPDPERTCFERDRDRVLHSAAFRRLAGKTQVFVFPADHQRTRLTHALEVAQVATSVARATGLNVALTEAIALGHDCGHGPGGHASEEAFDVFLPEGYDHAVWGAVALAPLNLCAETLDGICNHSWSRPAPSTPEGALVGWADRCAYTAHDLEDAVHAGIVRADAVPAAVRSVVGDRRSDQLETFIQALIGCITEHGIVGMRAEIAEALAGLRAFNYERIYSRPESVAQGRSVVAVLRALVEYYADRPHALDDVDGLDGVDGWEGVDGVDGLGAAEARPGSDRAIRAAVQYVAGMTDRYAFQTALAVLDWDPAKLPRGIDLPVRRG